MRGRWKRKKFPLLIPLHRLFDELRHYLIRREKFVGLHFKGSCDVILVTSYQLPWQRSRSTKVSFKFQFLYIIWKSSSVTYHFYLFAGKFPKLFNFSDLCSCSFFCVLTLHKTWQKIRKVITWAHTRGRHESKTKDKCQTCCLIGFL